MTIYDESFFTKRAGAVTASAAATSLGLQTKAAVGTFDVFLSHSVRDARVILGVREWLQSKGLTVYVDWIDDTQLDREKVSPATASQLRRQMDRSHTLIYATSQNAQASRWMPWELGYFDGRKGRERVSILPIDNSSGGRFTGDEYIGLYPRIEQQQISPGNLGPIAISPSGTSQRLSSFVRPGV
ncbi:toll/interleukin-1 receptor domain-containing protein [Rhodococcus sp. UNC23MFCrub1.1]|uniref:toll/interleukin-1 receptor domain-containing protein n=1 Tax=Rhodococcus sp. UNC23MFCrub1.1 TaxID=1449068 RepID=UPI0018CC0528|nr:toll/interleukin-1 receptor domain-containing protein [Rhodococcus sp. UNC23MFCrub1.1]